MKIQNYFNRDENQRAHVFTVVFFQQTWHQSRVCGAPDNPPSIRLASLHCQFPYGSSSCLPHSWTQLQSWAGWRPSRSRRGSCSDMDPWNSVLQPNNMLKTSQRRGWRTAECQGHPSRGSSAIARGCSTSPASRVVLMVPSNLATSIWSRLLSTQ